MTDHTPQDRPTGPVEHQGPAPAVPPVPPAPETPAAPDGQAPYAPPVAAAEPASKPRRTFGAGATAAIGAAALVVGLAVGGGAVAAVGDDGGARPGMSQEAPDGFPGGREAGPRGRHDEGRGPGGSEDGGTRRGPGGSTDEDGSGTTRPDRDGSGGSRERQDRAEREDRSRDGSHDEGRHQQDDGATPAPSEGA